MINLLYQTHDKDKGYLPNSIPYWKRNEKYYKNYGNVKFQYLEELLDYAGVKYNNNNTITITLAAAESGYAYLN